MISSTVQHKTALALSPFQSHSATTVSQWVKNPQQLRLLAPSSNFPLTSDGVRHWLKPGGKAFSLLETADAQPKTHRPIENLLGYGELNPMQANAQHVWIGHVIIDPARRAQGLGSALTNRLVHEAFISQRAERISLVVFPENTSAIRCYQKAGFTCVREELHRFGESTQQNRLYRFELLRTDYLAQTTPDPNQ